MLLKIYMLPQKKEDNQRYCIARNQAECATRELSKKFEPDLSRDIKEHSKKKTTKDIALPVTKHNMQQESLVRNVNWTYLETLKSIQKRKQPKILYCP